MILYDVYQSLSLSTGLDASGTGDQAKMREAMRLALKEMFRKCRLVALRTPTTLTTVADIYFYYLDSRYLFGVDFKQTTSEILLNIKSEEWFNKEYPNPSTTDTDKPTLLIPLYKVWVSAQPTAASLIAVKSSTADTGTVFIRGLVSGVEQSESITLNGASSVNSSNTYDTNGLISISKLTSTGTVTATSNSAAVTNISLLPAQTEKQHWKIRLHKVPDAAYSIPYTFYRKPWEFSVNEETIPFDDTFDAAFLTITTAILQKWAESAQWKDTWNLGMQKLEEARSERNFFAEDTDKRMGLIELDSQENDYWH